MRLLLSLLVFLLPSLAFAQAPVQRNQFTTNQAMNAVSDGWSSVWNATAKMWSNVLVAGAGGDAGGTNVNYGNIVFVRTNGSDATGVRGFPNKPFATPLGGKNASAFGDLIDVGPGFYASGVTNLLKGGVNWFFQIGSVLSNRVQQAGDDFWIGMFDDRFSGAVTSSIYGYGTFVWDGTDHDFGGNDIRMLGMLVLTNAGSQITFYGKRAEFYAKDGPLLPAVFYIANCRKFFIGLDEMEAPEYVENDADTVNASCLYWERGDVYGYIRRIKTEGYGVWCNTASDNLGITNDLYLEGDRWQTTLSAAIYTSMSNSTHRAWFRVKELETSYGGYGTVTLYDGGKTYIDTLLISGRNNVAIRGDNLYSQLSGCEAWITTQKIKGDRGWLSNNKAILWLSSQQYEDTASGAGSTTDKFFDFQGGYANILGGNAKSYANGIWQAGGTNFIDGLRMDSSAVANVTNVPLNYKGGLLTVKDIALTATNNAANAANAVAAQTLTIEGYLNANKIIDADITIAGTSTNTIPILHMPLLATNGFLRTGAGGIVTTGIIGANLSLSADGTLSATGAGAAAGNSSDIQFNQGGAFAGTNGFKWDRTNNALAINQGTIRPNSAIDIGGNPNLYTGIRVGASGTGKTNLFDSDGLGQLGDAAQKFYIGQSTVWYMDSSALRYSWHPALTNTADTGTWANPVDTNWNVWGVFKDSVVLGGGGSGTGRLLFQPTNGSAVLQKAANSNAVPVTNIVGLVELAAGTPTFLNANLSHQYVQTNRVTAATTFVWTNTAVGQEFSLVVPGEIAGGTSRVITLAAGTGSAASLVANLDVFGTALAFTMTFTLTNGNAAEINGKVARVHIAGAAPTNVVSFVTRQYAF